MVVVERDNVDASRVNIYLPEDVLSALRIIAVNATSYLSFTQ